MNIHFPIKTYQLQNNDPLNVLANSLSKLDEDDGCAIQFLIRPHKDGWQEKGRDLAEEMLENKKKSGFHFLNPLSWFSSLWDMIIGAENNGGGLNESKRTSSLTEERIKALEEKHVQVGFETIIRIVTSMKTKRAAKSQLNMIEAAFSQFNTPDLNSFSSISTNTKKLVNNFILRRFERTHLPFLKKNNMVLSSEELATLFHFPNSVFNESPLIKWQRFKIAPAPKNIPKEGVLIGHNYYRGKKTDIRLKHIDRFRHVYVIGQTGTGKSVSGLLPMIKHDLRAGNGLCIVDPHGSLIEEAFEYVPKDRADDVIFFNPADLDRPLGLNLLEANTPEERDMVALDAMNIMIKLFDEEIFGPRIQDYFRNGCLTLMEQPDGGALTDILRVFTDDDYQKMCLTHVTNPVVRSFWENQMAKTGAREKGEMIPYFAAKFGQFTTNTMIRNIIGQTKSAFDFGEVMQNKKILFMNLSKGETGDINSRLLGLIIVSKIQMAALRRQRIAEEDRAPFYLYIDEFQNYITDSIESILSEARKYKLGLIMANQYIKQLEGDDGKSRVKDAVFGNVGSMISFKIGATDAEYMAKEFAPVFSEQDLINIDKFKAVCKVSIDSQPSKPFVLSGLNPALDPGKKEFVDPIKQLARLKYGRDAKYINQEIFRRMGLY